MIRKWFQKCITILLVLALLAEPAFAAPLSADPQEAAVDTELAEEPEEVEEPEEAIETEEPEEAVEPEEAIEAEEPEDVAESEEGEEVPEEAELSSEEPEDPADAESEVQAELADVIDPDVPYYEPEGEIPDIENDGTWENIGINTEMSAFSAKSLLRSSSLPAKHDARESGVVSSVKNQAGWGSCWAFQAVSSAESSVLMDDGGEKDLSELQLVEFTYNGARGGTGEGDRQEIISERGDTSGDYTTVYGATKAKVGGNGLMSMFALSRWTGLGEESLHSTMTYDIAKTRSQSEMDRIPTEYAFRDALHLENGYLVPLDDRDSVKKMIMQYGSCGIDIYMNRSYDSSYTSDIYDDYRVAPDVSCMYNFYNSTRNHAVSVVGWDDDFPKENFADIPVNIEKVVAGEEPVLPQNNGAWLVKNSYGTDYGDGGYVWISYENKAFESTETSKQTVKVFDFADASNYGYVYQYDGSVGTKAYKVSHVAARYHTKDVPEMLGAAGIALQSANVDYTVSVYTGLSDPSDPESGYKAYTKSGRTEYPGFYTIKFDEDVLLLPDTDFSIVWDVSVDGETASVYAERAYEETGTPRLKFDARIGEHETFHRITSPNWTDPYNTSVQVTYRLKAYTDDALLAGSDISGTNYIFADYEESEFTKTFDTKPYQPKVDLIYEGAVLREDIEYDVKYQPAEEDAFGNITVTDGAPLLDAVSDAGTYRILYEGKGLFAGEKTAPVHFTLLPRPLEDPEIETQTAEEYARYDRKIHTFMPNTFYAESVLQEDTDCKIWYIPSRREGSTLVHTDDAIADPVQAGIYNISLEGLGNYTGTLETDSVLEIIPASIDEATVKTVSQEYGSVYEPVSSVYIMDGKTKRELIRGTDFTYDASDISVSGTTGSVRIHGIGNYNDTATADFALTGQVKISKVTVSAIPDQIYDGGKDIEPVLELKYRPNTKTAYTDLTEGTDYTLQYQKTVNNGIGKAKVTITGKGKYYGTRTVTYRIVTRPYSADRFLVTYADTEAGVPVAGYAKSGAKPALTIKYIAEDGEEIPLHERTDYTLTLANNTMITTVQTRRLPTVTVRFRGNYKGGIPARSFVIKPSTDLADAVKSVTLNDRIFRRYGSFKAAPVVTDVNGKQLVKDRDYSVSYFYAEDTTLTNGESRTAGDEVGNGERPVAGSRIGIRIDGIRYAGSLSYLSDEIETYRLSYRIYKKQIEKASVSVQPKICPPVIPEGGVTISKADLTVRYAGVVVPDEDYEIIPGSYRKNTKAGTAYVYIRGKNDYGGTKRISFRIKAKELLKEELSVSVNNGADVPYLKGGVNPAVTVKIGETSLIKNVDYTLSFSRNKIVRDKNENKPPTVTIKGKGNYSGTVSYPFTIIRQDLGEMLKETEGSKSSVLIKDMRYSKRTAAILSEPVLKDINGKKLSSADFTVSYVYAEPVVIGNRLIASGTEVVKGDIPPVGTKIKAVISGNGLYTGILDDPVKYDIIYRIVK